MYTAFALSGLVITLIITACSIYRIKKGTVSHIRILSSIGRFIDDHYIAAILLILSVYLVSRILKIESFPSGIHVDELSMAVDAKSLMLNGHDRSGLSYPPYFPNYGGGQNALYTYIQAFILNFIPASIFAFRIQAVFWGAMCLLAMYGIVYEITENHGFALTGPILVTTLPVYFMSERWGLESYLLLPFCTIVMYFIIKAVKTQKPAFWLLAGLLMGASLYTYAVSYIIWPLFLVLFVLYLLYIKELHVKQAVAFMIPLTVVSMPLILFQMVNFRILAPFRLWISDYVPLPIAREQELGLQFVLENFRFYGELFLGGEALTYNSLREFGTIYLFLLPFVVAGLIICIKKSFRSFKDKSLSVHVLFVYFWVASTICMHLVKAPNVNRVNALFLPFTVFIAVAFYELLSKSPLAISWLTVWLAASFLFFGYFYFFVQYSVYEPNELFSSSSAMKAIERSVKYYRKDTDTHIYVQFADEAVSPVQQVFYMAAENGDVYSDDTSTYGCVTSGLPEEININDNAVYIIGDQWPHITAYLISEGFLADQSLPGYSILFRLN
ncbi:MAG: glycosyltransferase family 39 protein [Lachnospiraceae bacterium]|nr:glycosyltransferase family 39 protein [Lachnospiraceae bacterium]